MEAPAQRLMKGAGRKKRPSAAKTKYSFIKVMKRSLKSLQKNSYSNVGTGAKLSGNSLGFIPTDNAHRTKLFKIVYSQATEYVLAFTICTHLVVLTLLASDTSDGDTLLVLKGLDITIVALYTIESIVRIFILGFFKGPDTYLKNFYNSLDFCIMLSSWMFLVLEGFGVEEPFRLGSLRALRLILCLRHLRGVSSLIAVMQTIGESLPLLVSVIDFTLMFGFFYALMGVSLFGGSFRRRCAVTDTILSEDTFMQGVTNTSNLMVHYITEPAELCGNTIDDAGDQKGFECPTGIGGVQHVCKDDFRNPNFGYTNFDDFGATLLTLFQCLTLENWDDVMFYTVDSEYKWSSVYYLSFVIVGSYFLLSTFVAAFSHVFLRLRKEHQAMAELARRKRMQKFVAAGKVSTMGLTLLNAVRGRGKNSIIGGTKKADGQEDEVDPPWFCWPVLKCCSFLVNQEAKAEAEQLMKDSGVKVEDEKKERKRDSFIVRVMKNHRNMKILNRVANCCIVVNIILLMAYTNDLTWKSTHHLMQIFFLILFVLELLIRMHLRYPWHSFFTDMSKYGQLNTFDFFLIVLSTIGVLTGTIPNLTMLRFFRLFIDSEKTSKIASKLLGAVKSMVILFIFFFIVLAFYSIMGMQLFSGHYNAGQGEDKPRDNFDSYGNAVLTMFGVATSEKWVNVMWDGMRSSRLAILSPLYFIPYFIFENFIVLNLIVAVILETLEFEESEKKVKQEELAITMTRYIVPPSVYLAKILGPVADRLPRLPSLSGCCGLTSLLRKKESKIAADPGPGANTSPATQHHTAWGDQDEKTVAAQPMKKARDKRASRIILQNSQQKIADDRPTRRASVTNGNGPEGGKRRRHESLARGSMFVRGSRKHEVGKFQMIVSGNVINYERLAGDDEQWGILNSMQQFINYQYLVHISDRKDLLKSGHADMELNEEDEKEAEPEKGKQNNHGQRFSIRTLLVNPDWAEQQVERWMGIEIIPSKTYELPTWMDDNTLGIFDMTHPLRQYLLEMLQSKWYSILGLIMILVSIIVVFVEKPVGRENDFDSFIQLANFAVAAFFIFETLFKFIAQGVMFTPFPYFLSWWNVLDFGILIIDLMAMFEYTGDKEKFVRVLLCLRPLRLFNRVAGLRELAVYLGGTFKVIMLLFGLATLIFLMFSMIAVKYFGGKFSYCNDQEVYGRVDCVGSFIDDSGVLIPRTWVLPEHNFDWVGKGVLTLFEIATLDEWLDVMYAGQDIVGTDRQPSQNHSSINAIFFVLFICVGSMFTVRAFIGVFIDQFALASGSKLLTEKQKTFRDLHRIVEYMKPLKDIERPKGKNLFVKLRRLSYDMIHSKRFGKTIVIIILMNCGFLASQHADQSDGWFNTLNMVDFLFVMVYLCELSIKLFGTGFTGFAKSSWNIFEAVLVTMSTLTLFPAQESFRLQAGRPFRFMRIFRIVRYVDSLKKILNRIAVTLPSLIQIIMLQLIFIIIYAGIATQVFADVKYGLHMNRKVNFETFTNSFLILFHSMTGEGWRMVMNDLKLAAPECTADYNGQTDCGTPFGSTAFFVTYIILCTYILTNLFVATILDYVSFGILKSNTLLSDEHLDLYQKLWVQYDRKGEGYLKLHRIGEFLDRLGTPIVPKSMHPKRKWRLWWQILAIHEEGLGIPFKHLLELLLIERLGQNALTYDVNADRKLEVEQATLIGAAISIQTQWRAYIASKNFALKRMTMSM
ncbi:voltage-gated calcium/sodium channel protein [Chloropicon primus]|uniref:Calcium-channel protein CCH1 n=1 Tax=Chloropicon primus TaxID=1764295 RepID=A0A5B8MJ68_9CHLO|nr:voltage-gated calcium/sodium channel protein [Chloropicon primus]|eukprot:QDZ20321.1 voltage-gated calcium/sodium channel protein [Chloropicon primus]